MIKKKTRRNPKLYPEQRIIHRDEEQEFLLQLAKIETQQQKERNLKLYPEARIFSSTCKNWNSTAKRKKTRRNPKLFIFRTKNNTSR